MYIQMPVEVSGSQSPVLKTGISKNHSSKRRHFAIRSHISQENQSMAGIGMLIVDASAWSGLSHISPNASLLPISKQ